MPASCRLRIAVTEQIVDHRNELGREFIVKSSTAVFSQLISTHSSRIRRVGSLGLPAFVLQKQAKGERQGQEACQDRLVPVARSGEYCLSYVRVEKLFLN